MLAGRRATIGLGALTTISGSAYLRRAAIRLVLRPKTFLANARDLALLESFIAAQVPRYVDLHSPTIIITGDHDTMVSPKINACALAATRLSIVAWAWK